jgi:putative SOS response-associated peptidase YedK
VHEKPSFRQAFRSRRCIIPASGFYEWHHTGNKKTPHYIRLRDGNVMSLAGLWEKWKAPHGEDLETCTILTTAANGLVRKFHDRMPVILHSEEFGIWLDRDIDDVGRLAELFHPYPTDLLTEHPVTLEVNSPNNDKPGCILPLDLAAGE